MPVTHIAAFETTTQKTYQWLDELVRLGQLHDEAQAYTALRAVLHALRDRLTVEEASHLGAQLPMLVRGFYYEGWNPAKTPLRYHSLDEFLSRVEAQMRNASLSIDAETAAREVFSLLSDKVTQGEIDDVRNMLPRDIRQLWPRD